MLKSLLDAMKRRTQGEDNSPYGTPEDLKKYPFPVPSPSPNYPELPPKNTLPYGPQIPLPTTSPNPDGGLGPYFPTHNVPVPNNSVDKLGPYFPISRPQGYDNAIAETARKNAVTGGNPNPYFQQGVTSQSAPVTHTTTGLDQYAPSGFDASGIMSQIQGLLGNAKGTEDRWVSPYSQDMLNRIGGNLQGTGDKAAAEYEIARDEILAQYGQNQQMVDSENNAFINEIAGNAGNIGVDYRGSDLGNRAKADFDFLSQVAGQNKQTDSSYFDKLGATTKTFANQLGQMARDGLLTPKQFIQGTPAQLSETDRIQVDLLKDQMARGYGLEDEQRRLLQEMTASSAEVNSPKITEGSSEDFLQVNPLGAEMIAGIQDPLLKNAAQTVWDSSGGDPTEALKQLAERANVPLPEVEKTPSPFNAFGMTMPSEMVSKIKRQLAERKIAEQTEMDAQLMEYFRRISPTYTGVPTKRTVSNDSKFTYPVGQ